MCLPVVQKLDLTLEGLMLGQAMILHQEPQDKGVLATKDSTSNEIKHVVGTPDSTLLEALGDV